MSATNMNEPFLWKDLHNSKMILFWNRLWIIHRRFFNLSQWPILLDQLNLIYIDDFVIFINRFEIYYYRFKQKLQSITMVYRAPFHGSEIFLVHCGLTIEEFKTCMRSVRLIDWGLNATFSSISAIVWCSVVLLKEKTLGS